MAHESTKKLVECLNCFDFKRVQTVMEKLDWKWAGDNGAPYYIPDETALREEASRLLFECLEYSEAHKKDWTVGCGGFEVSTFYTKKTGVVDFSLKFIVSDWDTF